MFKSVNCLFFSTALDFRRCEAFLQDINKGEEDGDYVGAEVHHVTKDGCSRTL